MMIVFWSVGGGGPWWLGLLGLALPMLLQTWGLSAMPQLFLNIASAVRNGFALPCTCVATCVRRDGVTPPPRNRVHALRGGAPRRRALGGSRPGFMHHP